MPFIGNIGPLELLIVLILALIILGPGKLPEVGAALGRTIREFRKASSEINGATDPQVRAQADRATPATPATPTEPAASPAASESPTRSTEASGSPSGGS